MLQKIRDNSKGLVAYILLGLLILSFAVWGIDFQFGGSDYLVRVNGEDVDPNRVTRTYQSQLQAYQNAYPNGIPSAQLEELKRNVLLASAREQVIFEHARALGLSVSDDALARFIETQPGFQLGGQFSMDQFTITAQREGFTVQGLEEYVRRAMVGNQLAASLVQTAFVTDAERRRRGALERESRTLSFYTIPAAPFEADIEPDEATIQAAYDADRATFRSPESVRLEYIQLQPSDLTREVSVDEETVRQLYDAGVEAGIYADEETRKSSHILLSVPADDDDADAEVKARAEALLERINAGEDFAALAAENSDDPGTRNDGGALDWSPRTAFVGPFSDALFDMELDEVRGPVRTTFGYHIIRLDGVRESAVKPYEDVRDEILEEEKLRRAADLIDEVSRELDEAVYDNDDSLQPASDATGLPVQETPWVTRAGGAGIASDPIVREAAFSDSVLLDRRNSQALRLDDGYVYIRVAEHRPSEIRDLEAVRPALLLRLKREAAAEKAAEAGAAARTRLDTGEDFAALAEEAGAELREDVTATRLGNALDPDLAEAVFGARSPADGTPTIGGATLRSGDYAVFVIKSAELGAEVEDSVAQRVAQTIGSSEFGAYVDSLMADADVRMRPDALQ